MLRHSAGMPRRARSPRSRGTGRQKTAGVPITDSDSAGLIGAQPVVVGPPDPRQRNQPRRVSPHNRTTPGHDPTPHRPGHRRPLARPVLRPVPEDTHPEQSSAGRRSTHPTSSDLPSVAPGAAGSTTPKLDAPRERSGLKWPSVDRRGGNGPLAQRDDAVSGGPPAVNPASAASSNSAAPR